MEQLHHKPSVVKRTLNALAWVLIALLLAATFGRYCGQQNSRSTFDLGRAFRKAANPELPPDARWVAAYRIDLQIRKDKMTRIGINGFGRMGRLALRAGWDCPDVSIVHVNEIKGGAATAAHLLEFDSVTGVGPGIQPWLATISPLNGAEWDYGCSCLKPS